MKNVKTNKLKYANMLKIMDNVYTSEQDKSTRRILKTMQKEFQELIETLGTETMIDVDVKQDFLDEYKRMLESEITTAEITGVAYMYGWNNQLVTELSSDPKETGKKISAILAGKTDREFYLKIGKAFQEEKEKEVEAGIREPKQPLKIVEFIDFLEKQRSDIIKVSKVQLSERIRFLNRNGFIDDYIETANSYLREQGMEALEYKSRVAPASKYFFETYDENGKPIDTVTKDLYDNSDIQTSEHNNRIHRIRQEDRDYGVLDIDEYLSEINDFGVLTALQVFWNNKYVEARVNMSNALQTVENMELWDMLIYGSEEDIDELDYKELSKIAKKAHMLRYIKDIESEEEIEAYTEFLKALEAEETELSEDKKSQEYLDGIDIVLNDIQSRRLDMLLVMSLQRQSMGRNNVIANEWGKVGSQDGIVHIGMNNDKFRVPIVFPVQKADLKDWKLNTLPGYPDKQYINDLYATTGIPIPVSEVFAKAVEGMEFKNPNLGTKLNQKAKPYTVRTKSERDECR